MTRRGHRIRSHGHLREQLSCGDAACNYSTKVLPGETAGRVEKGIPDTRVILPAGIAGPLPMGFNYLPKLFQASQHRGDSREKPS